MSIENTPTYVNKLYSVQFTLYIYYVHYKIYMYMYLITRSIVYLLIIFINLFI